MHNILLGKKYLFLNLNLNSDYPKYLLLKKFVYYFDERPKSRFFQDEFPELDNIIFLV